jgi:hypothetical protein
MTRFINTVPSHIEITEDGDIRLTLSMENDAHLLITRWEGYATPENVHTTLQAALNYIGRHPTLAIGLCDVSQLGGDCSDLVPWIIYEFLPAILAANWQALAYVVSPDLNIQHSINIFTQAAVGRIAFGWFTNEADARVWLVQFAANQALYS